MRASMFFTFGSFASFASLAFLAHCDMLKRGREQAAVDAAPAASNTTTAATGETMNGADPTKGATAGCVWPEDGKKDITITKGCSLDVKHTLEIEEGATLTIEEGVKLSFDTDQYLWVNYGKLIVKGTEAKPVTFTSANKSPAAGDWVGIGFREKTSAGTSLDHVIIEYAGSASSSGVGAIHIEDLRQGGRISITSSTIRNSSQFGIVADDNATFAKFENNTLKDNKTGSIRAYAEVLGSVGRGNTFSQPLHVHESTVNQTTTWPAFDAPVVVDGNITIKGESSIPTLTIADRTVVKMGQEHYISISDGTGAGALVAKNVTFTSYSPAPAEGDWVGFFLYAKSGGTDIEGCTFEYFGSGSNSGSGALTLWSTSVKDLKGVTIANNTFRKGKIAAMRSDDNDCGGLAKTNKVEGIPFCYKP